MSTSPTLAEPKADLSTAQPAAGGEISAEALQRFGAEFDAEPAYEDLEAKNRMPDAAGAPLLRETS